MDNQELGWIDANNRDRARTANFWQMDEMEVNTVVVDYLRYTVAIGSSLALLFNSKPQARCQNRRIVEVMFCGADVTKCWQWKDVWEWSQTLGGCKWKFGVLDLQMSKIGASVAVACETLEWKAGATSRGWILGSSSNPSRSRRVSDPRERMVCA